MRGLAATAGAVAEIFVTERRRVMSAARRGETIAIMVVMTTTASAICRSRMELAVVSIGDVVKYQQYVKTESVDDIIDVLLTNESDRSYVL